ncbi:MAG: YkgJ family cysteine cluster protein [Methanoregula sp.]|nr:MAG: YkgJ family cysteine cluster protein [Methanoregula sp.]
METNTCDRCGLCCKYVIIPLDKRDRSWRVKVNLEWMAARGIRIIKGNLVIPSICPHLQVNPCPYCGEDYCQEGPDWCDIYATRPAMCRMSGCRKDLLEDLEPAAAAAR